MAEKRENSVLFSLRELQEIEEERVQEEVDAARVAEEQRIRVEIEAERQRRDAEEATRRAHEDETRRQREAADRQVREDQLRLEEAERKAQIEAQSRIEQQRLQMEMEVKKAAASRKSPKVLVAASVVLVLAVGGLGIFLFKQRQDAAAEKQRADQEYALLERQIDGHLSEIERLSQEMKGAHQKLLDAQTDEEKVAAQRQVDETEAELEAKKAALKKLRDRRKGKDRGKSRDPDTEPDKAKGPKCDPNDPLCGIGG
jgi:hypothetical protein